VAPILLAAGHVFLTGEYVFHMVGYVSTAEYVFLGVVPIFLVAVPVLLVAGLYQHLNFLNHLNPCDASSALPRAYQMVTADPKAPVPVHVRICEDCCVVVRANL
jgi:hypothetical protein